MAFSGCMGQCASTYNLHAVECPGRYGPYGELSFFLLKKEPMVLWELVRFGLSIPVESLKACALIGLHIMIQENSGRSENGCCVSSSSSDENNVGNDALFVIGSH